MVSFFKDSNVSDVMNFLKVRNKKFSDLKINDRFILVSLSGEFIKFKKVSDTEAKYKAIWGSFEIGEIDPDYPIIKI